ncbi:MAG: DMT family transporter [Planctomycetota bacterium]
MDAIPYFGEICALAAPLAWSFAVILFRKTGERVPPLALNLFKNVLALGLFAGTLAVVGSAAPGGATGRDYGLLLASGVLGIGVSDTLFLMCLNRIGAGLQAIVNTSYSPFNILLSMLYLGERLTLPQFLGVGLILSAVLSVGWMRGPGGTRDRRRAALGVTLGLAATLTQAVSIVGIKPLLDRLPGESLQPLLWATSWRIVGGTAATALLIAARRSARRSLRSLRDARAWPVMVPASLLGTYVSLLFWMGGMKYTLVSVASALNQTATLFTFVLAVLLLHEPATGRRLLGLVLGLGGVALVTFAGA